MRFLFSADWHIHPWRECSRDGGQDRLQDGLSAVRQLLQAARDRACPLVVGGDLKHLRDRWVLSALNGLLALFEEYADVPKVLLHGNHDGVAGGRSGLEAFRALKNVLVLTEPVVGSKTWRPFDGAELVKEAAFWPHRPTLDGLLVFLEQARKAKARVLFAHAFLAGAVLGPDEVRLPGVGATLEQFRLAGKHPVFSWGLFGDVHKAQAMPGNIAGVRGVWYPGSPHAQNWGERETDKGAFYVDLDAGTVEVVPVKAPRFVVVDWTDSVTDAELEEALGTETDFGWEGDFVRLLINDRVGQKLLERLREASGARAFQVIVQRESRAEQRADVHGGLPQGELLKRYVAARPPGDGLEPAKVLAAGQRLLGERS